MDAELSAAHAQLEVLRICKDVCGVSKPAHTSGKAGDAKPWLQVMIAIEAFQLEGVDESEAEGGRISDESMNKMTMLLLIHTTIGSCNV